MNIAIFTDTYLPTIDGVVTSVLISKKGLKDKGHRVVIYAPGDDNSPEEEGTIYCRSRRFKGYPGYRMVSILPTWEFRSLKDFNADVIHSHGVAGMGIKSLWLSKDLGIPCILTFHTMVGDAMRLYSPVALKPSALETPLRYYLRRIMHRYNVIIVPTASILSEVEDIAPRMKRVEIVPTGVDVDRFTPRACSDAVKEKYGLEGHKVILNVGRMAREKNIHVLIDALPMVKRDFPNAKLMLVGDGPALTELREMASRKKLENDVIFTGFVDSAILPEYYACADVFATASKFETQGLVVLEAMACGKPVVGANYRAIPEFVVNGETGYLFEPDSAEDCASSIRKILKGDDGDLTKETRKMAEAHSTKASTKKLVQVYKEAAEARGRKKRFRE